MEPAGPERGPTTTSEPEPSPHAAPTADGGSRQPGPAARPAATAPAELVPLDPRVRVLWWVTGAGQVLAVGVVVALVDALVTLPLPRGVPTLVVLAVLGVIAAVVPVLRFRRWRYALREQDLWIRRGVLWVTISVIPFARLQFVDTRQGPLDRLFGLSQLIVHTAALGTSGRLPGLDVDVAARLRERLSEVEAGEAASV